MSDSTDDDVHISDEGAVDDSNTIEGQLTTAGGQRRLPSYLAYQLQKYVSDVRYPASKAELYDHAERRGADRPTLDALGRLRQASYNMFEDVRDELSIRGEPS